MARKRSAQDVLKSYRYLRIGIIGAVVLLGVSIEIEHLKTHCWQSSISSYYYTPVRAVFVGALFAVGLSLIVYTGRTAWEDLCLNFAGMFAPVVAVAPTLDFGKCWSAAPNPLPIVNGKVSDWVVENIHNNITSLLIIGGLGLLVATAIAIGTARSPWGPFKLGVGTWLPLLVTAAALLIGWWASRHWGSFNTRAHGYAALAFFVFLGGAILATSVEQWHAHKVWSRFYLSVAVSMALGGVLAVTGVFGLFGLEVYEIISFLAYWLAQTVQNWTEEVALEISLDPNSGPGGTTVRVAGSGFHAEEDVRVRYVHSVRGVEDLVVATADPQGDVAADATIPPKAATGRHKVKASGVTSHLETKTLFEVVDRKRS
jgi:hypothetical protein